MAIELSLRQQRILFTRLIAELIVWVYDNLPGYELTFNEVVRPQAQADANAASGAGISNSLHLVGLAADLNLYIDGVYQTSSNSHKPIADKWLSMHPLNRWGGNFKKPDGNHYSSTRNGIQ